MLARKCAVASMKRFSGSRISPRSAFPLCESGNSDRGSPGYSGGTASASHRLPYDFDETCRSTDFAGQGRCPRRCYACRVRWLLLVFITACGGTVAAVDGGMEAGTDSGCPQPPSAPVYACDAGLPDAQGCGPWGSTQTTPTYPIGCVVTTPGKSTYCGPVTCSCSTEFPDSGPSWICPL